MTAYQPATALPRDFLNREDVRTAIAAHDFGTVFRLARSEAAISYSKIAAECDIKPERVGALARGHGSVTTFEKIAQIADALRIPGHMLGLAPRPWESAKPYAPTPVVPAPTITESRDGEDTVRRREFFKASAGAGLATGLPELDQIKSGRRIGHTIPDQLRKRTARLRRLDDVLSGGSACHIAGPDASPGVRALLHERLAWAYAVAGHASATEQALNDAETALSEDDGTPQPDWVAWVDRNELQIMTGRCWTELRRPLRAVPVLEDALATYDDAHARDKSLYLSWLADSYLAAGEVEQAAKITGRALELSSGVASVRPRQRLAPTLRRLGNHRDLPAVADVLERAQA
ncbi:XRE family transcriptional regulator [Streptomyces sp. C10]|uniref:XRE family transcriptional regulator n=1 Tax=Streptomyces sp. C10 TaxID=531941 RepID=UPI003980B6F2